jgi:hypothetical protein
MIRNEILVSSCYLFFSQLEPFIYHLLNRFDFEIDVQFSKR